MTQVTFEARLHATRNGVVPLLRHLVLSTWLCVASDRVTYPMQLYGRRGRPRVLYAYGSVGLLLTVLLAAAVLPSIARLLGGRRRVTGRASA